MHLCGGYFILKIMLQQFKTRRSNEHSMTSERSFHLLQDVKLDRVYRVMRYVGTALLSMAYLVVIVICVIEKHPMSSYLMMSLFIVFLIGAIAILPHIKTIKNNY
jgi:hypothetical protein